MWSSRWFLSTPGIQVVTQHVPRLPHWSSVRLPFVRRLLRTFGSSSSDDRDHPDHARAEGQRRAKMTGPVPDVIVVGRRNKNKATPTAEELDSLLKEYASAREKKIEDKVLHVRLFITSTTT